jgi:hypothetical protein
MSGTSACLLLLWMISHHLVASADVKLPKAENLLLEQAIHY